MKMLRSVVWRRCFSKLARRLCAIYLSKMLDFDVCFETSLNFLLTLPCMRRKAEDVWQEFLDQKIPIFWIFGPPKCGKATLVHQLMECTMYRVIRVVPVEQLLEENQIKPTTENLIEYLRNEIKETFRYVQGYIIEDFPRNIHEAYLFERRICKVTVAIYLSLSLDAVLGRTLSYNPIVNLNELRILHVIKTKNAKKIFKKFTHRNVAINVISLYPVEETLRRCLELLENEFGYKFVNKNIKH